MKDFIYINPVGKVGAFKFDEKVAEVFTDRIDPVPGYRTIISATGLLAERLAQPHSVCYDPGCSLARPHYRCATGSRPPIAELAPRSGSNTLTLL